MVSVRISVGERFDAGAASLLSRLTASGPSAEPDGGNIYQIILYTDIVIILVLLMKLIMLIIQ